jgi:uncharacterized protein (TIGR00255 family)
MTGFGTGHAADDAWSVHVEVRSVNAKTLDVKLRLPREIASREASTQAAIRGRAKRGRVELAAELRRGAGAVIAPRINAPLARGYLQALRALESDLGLGSQVNLQMILGAPGVVELPEPEGDEALLGLFDAALESALRELDQMREREGQALEAELSRLLGEVTSGIGEIDAAVPQAAAQRAARLEARLLELTSGLGIDPLRLAQEIAVLVDRSDITEELARAGSHLEQLRATFDSAEPAGRRGDFLLQEIHREVNTIGAKASNARISHLVVDLKTKLERLREQIQNVE